MQILVLVQGRDGLRPLQFVHACAMVESPEEGETLRFINDHDPLPLLDQIGQRYGKQIGMACVTREVGNNPNPCPLHGFYPG